MYVSQTSAAAQPEIDLEGWTGNPALTREVFTSLSQRLTKEAPDLLPAFNALKASMDVNEFEKYFESLVRIRQNRDLLLVITDKPMHRSIIEGRYMKKLAKCFNAKIVRVLTRQAFSEFKGL